MENIYNRTLAGTLTADDLKDDNVINYVHPKSKLTLLGASVWNGHINQVNLLLEKGANPNKADESRPPLWVAASKTRKNAGRIIEILLNNQADPTLPSAIDGNSTPLLGAVKTYKSPAIISALVDAGALPTTADGKNETPKQVATDRKDRDRLRAMLPRSERTGKRLPALLMLSGLLLFIIAWANKNVIAATAATAITGGALVDANAIKNRFNMSGRFDSDTLISSDSRSMEEFKKDVRKYIDQTKLDRFFPPGNQFLQKVLHKAVELDANPNNTLDVRDLIRLALYQPVLYCDDSGSMKRDHRHEHQKDLVDRIARITTQLVPDNEGIELRFINKETDPRMSKPDLGAIDRIMADIPFNGWTEIGTNLKKILEDIVYTPVGGDTLRRPVLISILTDGHPNGPKGTPERRDTLKEAILECGTFLRAKGYDSKVVRFQISQVGSDDEAGEFLRSLDSDATLQDVLYCTAERLDTELQNLRDNDSRLEQWLLELLMGPILDSDAA
ncbi:hypothetical protein F5B21DRAFT_494993 [Xylaria acuta]|nr:hypothetical protein F5B21DRAFT_494993 [Xylaria acuta]